MKRLVILLAVLSALLLLSPAAQAADVEAAQREALGTDRLEKAVPGSAGEEMGRLTVDDAWTWTAAWRRWAECCGRGSEAR